MKTPEEWARLVTNKTDWENLVAEILLEGMKEGARRAAEIAKQESDRVCHEDPFAFLAIERAAEQWTIKDLL